MAILEERRVHSFPCNSGGCSSCSQTNPEPGQKSSDGDDHYSKSDLHINHLDQHHPKQQKHDQDDDDKDYRGDIANNLTGHTSHQHDQHHHNKYHSDDSDDNKDKDKDYRSNIANNMTRHTGHQPCDGDDDSGDNDVGFNDDDDKDKDKVYRGDIANNLTGHTGHQPGPGAARPRPDLMLIIITLVSDHHHDE